MATHRPLPVISEADVAPDAEEELRHRVYEAISVHVTEAFNGRVPVARNARLGRAVLEGVTEIIFTVVAEKGYFRFPSGFGSIKVQRLKADPQPKRLPTGEVVRMPQNRVKLRYDDGAAIREQLGLPKKTPYARRSSRKPKLSERAQKTLAGAV